MFKTRVTELFGIEYPIIQGAMAHVSAPELTAAVSNAGGLGILVSATCGSREALREEIRRTKALTDKPFGVNLGFLPSVTPIPNDEYVRVVIEEKVAMVETSGTRAPAEFIQPLHDGGVKVMHKCASVRHAQTAERTGADAVAVVGFENGGAMGMDDITTFILVPLTADAVKVPVLAGGGIGDGRGFAAALALGAEGVVVGTRFMATKESCLHPKCKEWMITCTERDTIPIQRTMRFTHRVLRNKVAEKVLEMEQRGATVEELLEVVGGEGVRKVMHEGDLEGGIAHSGQVVGMIREVTSVKEVIDDMVNGAKELQKRLRGMIPPT
jgi:nitronate monooxygenase